MVHHCKVSRTLIKVIYGALPIGRGDILKIFVIAFNSRVPFWLLIPHLTAGVVGFGVLP